MLDVLAMPDADDLVIPAGLVAYHLGAFCKPRNRANIYSWCRMRLRHCPGFDVEDNRECSFRCGCTPLISSSSTTGNTPKPPTCYCESMIHYPTSSAHKEAQLDSKVATEIYRSSNLGHSSEEPDS